MTVTAELADLRSLTDDELADLYGQGDDDQRAAVLAECARRDRAGRARQARRAVAAEWYDTAFAQYLAAEQECKGRLLSAEGMVSGPADPFSLWRMPERQALRYASEELRNHWLDHPRLTLAQYRRQLAAAKRADRDERDLANGTAEPENPWQRVPGGAVRPASVPVGSRTVAAWTAMDAAGIVTFHPSRARAESWLAPVPETAPAPSPAASPAVPGSIARYMTALSVLASHTDAMAARITTARGVISNGGIWR